MSSELPPYTTIDAMRSISFTELSSIVGKNFKIIQGFIDGVHGGIPTFILQEDKNSKTGFEKLKRNLGSRSLLPILRAGEEKDQYVLRIVPERRISEGQTTKKRKIPTQLVLLVATIVSVTIAGYFISQIWFDEIGLHSHPLSDTLVTMAEYATALMAILTVHELGHMIASKIHMMKTSLPYFIPAPPIIPGTSLITPGTFGALITQSDPLTNRDQLFDIGIAGPLSGFVVAMIVTFLGVSLSQTRPIEVSGGIQPPPIMSIMFLFFNFKGAVLIHPLGEAGFLGLIITALNLFPVSQMDGGHMSRALFGSRGYERASTISLLFLLILGIISPFFLPFALLLFFFSFGVRHPGPLDDVSGISKGRKIAGIIGFLILFLSLPMEYLNFLPQ